VSNRLLGHDLSQVDGPLGRSLSAHSKKVAKDLRATYCEQRGSTGISLASFETVIDHCPSNKKTLYTKTMNQIFGVEEDGRGQMRPGFDLVLDGSGTAFSKIENYYCHPVEVKKYYDPLVTKTKLPRPRCIVARNLRHVLYMARILLPIEDWIYQNYKSPAGHRVMAKGLNSVDAGNLLAEKWKDFRTPVALCGDCSSFDGHVSTLALKAIHKFYYTFFPQLRAIPEYKDVFKAQLENHVSSRLGLSFSCKGRRMSGDRDTAFGNTMLTVLMVSLLFEIHHPNLHYELICDGDDFVIICEHEVGSAVMDKLISGYKSFGHELEFDVVTSVFEKIDFCQKHPVHIDETTVKLVRNPLKVFSGSTHSTRNYDSPQSIRKLFKGVGLGDGYCNEGVPLLYSFAKMIYRVAAGNDLPFQTLDQLDALVKSLHPSDPLFQRLINEKNLPRFSIVSEMARVSFFYAYGFTPMEQILLEAQFDSISKFDFDTKLHSADHPVTPLYTK
jgi:hypothetical protein